ncbi:MAG: 4-hydroxythreonine-4-phosphate dehydrogenase PdxA [Thermodesulfobacteriota bacterium]
MDLPKIGVTMGDPTGIGPEIIVKALSQKELYQVCRPIVFGDQRVLLKTLQNEGLSMEVEILREIPEEGYGPQRIFLICLSEIDVESLRIGKPDRKCGQGMVRYIEEAVKKVMEGSIDAITTCPINKQAINDAGYPFSGHTELLAHLTHSRSVAMMFLGSKWKVVLVTTHLPIGEVPRWISKEHLLSIFRLAWEGMREYFGCPRPRIAVLGLNPHCGEEGLLGKEEEEIIIPAIREAKSKGWEIEGPFSADSFFNLSLPTSFDGVVAMYHDQGLIPIKIFGIGDSVQLTLGLPFVRTSVSHGTAYDIAGRGLADPRSLIKAILMAANLSKFKKNY